VRNLGQRASPRLTLLAILVLLAAGVALAENIDPASDGSKYAWAENVGWFNAKPSGIGGPGVQVSDFELTGYMWSENAGWVSLSCKDHVSCDSTPYGVINNGHGVLSGYAWAENVGWINFAPATSGVFIDVTTGDFSGRAWGENVGWITFASNGASPFKVRTGWNCSPAPPLPAGSPALNVDKSGADTRLSWGGITGATGYDIVKGNLVTLISSSGNFALATDSCLANDPTTTTLLYSNTPAPGQGFWFLVRGENCGGRGTYDSGGATQVGLRDAEISASGNDCP